MVEVRILLKHSTSVANQDLLKYLHTNINVIKKHADLKIIIVYKNLVPKLKGSIKSLPAMIINSSVVYGTKAMKQKIKNLVNRKGSLKNKKSTFKNTPTTSGSSEKRGSDDLHDFWHSEMHGKDDNAKGDAAVDTMVSVSQRAAQRTSEHQKSMNRKKSGDRNAVVPQNTGEETEMLEGTEDNIADMETDPFMKQYWENQQTSM